MAKQTLYMDYRSSKSLQIFLSYLISNGEISGDACYYLFRREQMPDNLKDILLRNPSMNLSTLLSILTLYDEIVISPIKGLPQIDESLLDEMGIHYRQKTSEQPWASRLFVDNTSISAEEAEYVIRSHKREILEDYSQEKGFIDYWTNYDFNVSDSFDHYLDSKYHLDILPSKNPITNLSMLLDKYILDKTLGSMRLPAHILKMGEYDFMDYLDATFECLAGSMRSSYGTFYSNILSTHNWKRVTGHECERIDNIVLAADFSSGIGVIPHPETIQEVISWRKYPDMISFRAVFSDWVHTLRNGDIQLADKMREEICKANNQLKKLDKYDKLNKNAMVALIKIGLSQVPGIDKIITVSDFLTPYITDYQFSKNSWVNLPAFNPVFKTLQHGLDKSDIGSV